MASLNHTAALASLLLLPMMTTAATAQGARGAAAPEVLTNESIVQMVTAKVPKNLITTKIQTTKATFDLTPTGLLLLSSNKVPGDLIKLMLTTAGENRKEVLTNESIIKMVTGRLSKDVITTKIQLSRGDFDLTTAGLISLNQNKVSQDIIKAMMAANAAAPTAH